MRLRGFAYLVGLAFIAFASGCSSSSNTPDSGKAGHDGATGGSTGDAAVDVVLDQTQNDTAADTATTDATDATDAPAGEVAPGSRPQNLTLTLLVTDPPPKVDAGADAGADGATDAAATDATAGDTAGDVAATDAATDVAVTDAAADAGSDADGGSASGDGPTIDPNLVNPWGLAFNPSGPLWVADNHSGVSTIYSATGQPMSLVVTVAVPDGGTPPSAPTGLVFNAVATAFMGDKFVFSSEDGTITGWQTGTTAALRVDNSATSTIYKGLALATSGGVSRLFATDFHNGKVDVFDSTYAKVTPAGGFTDTTLPAGYAPFGVQAIGATIYVSYAKQDDMKEDDVSGEGRGYVDTFDFDGHLVKRLLARGALNSPWGMALAPADFGAFSNALVVGNFGDGHINAYDPATGALIGAALDPAGVPIAIDGLWALVFGNDTAGAPHNRLFFTAGPDMESHGQLGHLDLPSP